MGITDRYRFRKRSGTDQGKRHGADIRVGAVGSVYATFATLPSVGTVEIVFSTCEAIW